MSVAEWVKLIMSVVTGLAALTGAVVAVLGLSTWRRQLRGGAEYELARRVLRAVLALRNEIRNLRCLYAPIGFSGSADAIPRQLESLNRAAIELDAELVEAEVMWNSLLSGPKQSLKNCVDDLWVKTRSHRQVSERLRAQHASDSLRDKLGEIEAFLAPGEPDNDVLGRDVQAAVDAFAAGLRPFLRR